MPLISVLTTTVLVPSRQGAQRASINWRPPAGKFFPGSESISQGIGLCPEVKSLLQCPVQAGAENLPGSGSTEKSLMKGDWSSTAIFTFSFCHYRQISTEHGCKKTCATSTAHSAFQPPSLLIYRHRTPGCGPGQGWAPKPLSRPKRSNHCDTFKQGGMKVWGLFRDPEALNNAPHSPRCAVTYFIS